MLSSFHTDVNECKNKGLCEFGTCQNTDGDFECNCLEGYKAINDGKRCKGKRLTSITDAFKDLIYFDGKRFANLGGVQKASSTIGPTRTWNRTPVAEFVSHVSNR